MSGGKEVVLMSKKIKYYFKIKVKFKIVLIVVALIIQVIWLILSIKK